MEYLKGDRVKHPTREDWGMGRVLADSDGKTVRIFFVNAGEKTIALQYMQPVKLAQDDSSVDQADGLQVDSSHARYHNLAQSIKYFLAQFPDGFYGERFYNEAREDKEKAHTQATELLDEENFVLLLGEEDYAEIIDRALTVMTSSNLILPSEKITLREGLLEIDSDDEEVDGHEIRESFCQNLFELLYGSDDIVDRFEAFTKVLEELHVEKWSVATVLPFLFNPEQFIFVKQGIVQHAANLCGKELEFGTRLTGAAYKSVQDFAAYLFNELVELEPRDMIDVQSFMWCIAPEHL